MENKKQELLEIQQQIQQLFNKGNDVGNDKAIGELYEKQMKILKTLDPEQENERQIMKDTIEFNKKQIEENKEKKEELLKQVGKMADTQSYNKKYDLYK